MPNENYVLTDADVNEHTARIITNAVADLRTQLDLVIQCVQTNQLSDALETLHDVAELARINDSQLQLYAGLMTRLGARAPNGKTGVA